MKLEPMCETEMYVCQSGFELRKYNQDPDSSVSKCKHCILDLLTNGDCISLLIDITGMRMNDLQCSSGSYYIIKDVYYE